jgi:hypothetical protein
MTRTRQLLSLTKHYYSIIISPKFSELDAFLTTAVSDLIGDVRCSIYHGVQCEIFGSKEDGPIVNIYR